MNTFHKFENSTSIQSCDYDDETKILSIIFLCGKEYKYENVSKSVYEDLKDAESPGKYFIKYIKPVYKVVE